MALSKIRSSTLYRVTYKRRGWLNAKSRIFGTDTAANKFVAKLRAGGAHSFRGEAKTLKPIVLLRLENGVVAWQTAEEMVVEETKLPNPVRATALDRFLDKYGHPYGEDPDDIYDLRELEQEIRNAESE